MDLESVNKLFCILAEPEYLAHNSVLFRDKQNEVKSNFKYFYSVIAEDDSVNDI